MPEITVVITAYNLERHLPNRLVELERQTFQDYDLVLLDDCSPDGTAAIIRDAADSAPQRIHALLLNSNLGSPARTRNLVLDSGLIKGTYVLFLDGDDALEPTFLEKLYNCAKTTGADMSICAYDRVDELSGKVLCREMQGFPASVQVNEAGDLPAYINTSLWNKLIRVELIGNTRIPDFRVGEDMAFMAQLYPKCTRIAFIDEILIHYQVRNASVISNTSEATIWAFAGALENRLCKCAGSRWFETLALMTYIHIGISMVMRAADNPSINFRDHVKKTRQYLVANGLLSCEYLKLRVLLRHGFRGLSIYISWIAYRTNCFGLIIRIYGIMIKKLHFDIKF